ncbi:MAG: NAD(P)-dependent oxidoreductase [Paracoccaceae bacterium]|nr:NAD(P)-dependent oxidoreductase [Paracoccaceae bacterium]
MERIGVLGLGRMGRAMAVRLAGQGWPVVGWTRSGADAEELGRDGVQAASSIEEAVVQSDVFILSLFDGEAVTQVLDRLARFDLAGKLVVETSTVDPTLCQSAKASIEAAGGRIMDAPVSGGPETIAAGSAGFYLGGGEEDVARFRPVVEVLGARVVHIGPLGAGASAKVLNNMMLCGYWETLCEAVRLGRALGLDLDTMMTFLGDSPAATPAMKGRMSVILGHENTVGFPVSGVAKDTRVIEGVAARLGIEAPALSAGAARFQREARTEAAELDLAAVVPRAFAADD